MTERDITNSHHIPDIHRTFYSGSGECRCRDPKLVIFTSVLAIGFRFLKQKLCTVFPPENVCSLVEAIYPLLQ